MNLTNEQIQALKAAAEISADNFKPVMVVDTKFILSLLAEREADKALIAEQDARLIEYARIATENAARTLTVTFQDRCSCCYSEEEVEMFYGILQEVTEALESACADAGITLKVGGEDDN